MGGGYRNVFSLSFWRLEVQDQGVSKMSSIASDLSPWFSDGYLFSMLQHGLSSVYTYPSCLSPCVFNCSYKLSGQVELGPTLMPQFNLITSLMPSLQKQSHSEVPGVRASIWIGLGKHNSVQNTPKFMSSSHVKHIHHKSNNPKVLTRYCIPSKSKVSSKSSMHKTWVMSHSEVECPSSCETR